MKPRLRLPVLPLERPRTRADCKDGPRPCPWFDCAHHLWAVTDSHGRPPKRGQTRARLATVPWSAETCALDLADRGAEQDQPMSLSLIGEVLGVSNRMASRILRRAIAKVRRELGQGDALVMEKRVLVRREGEDMQAAIARARGFGWWRRVVSPRPTNAGRAWVWLLKPEAKRP